MSRKDISWVECWKVDLIVGWKLFTKFFMDSSCLMVPNKSRKMSSMNLFQKVTAQIKATWMVSLWRPITSFYQVTAMEQIDTLIFDAIIKLRNNKKQPNENSIHTLISKDCKSLSKKQLEERLLTLTKEIDPLQLKTLTSP